MAGDFPHSRIMATAKIEIYLAGGIKGAWRFVCPCCDGIHALTDAQVKGADYACHSQDIIGNPKENDIDSLLDALGMVSALKCNTVLKTPKRQDRNDTSWFDPYT